ncbi:tRNA (guanosine(37)-N1)-methyltransferase TrmD [Mycoplasma miroungirhinis]|uniref:tRNA (guanine-N(1)-)-methyltransferase n=1 Tax=Mycoplasma miroungirhinis TaxID=754516 RepID=A0A6M4JG73_9MOLU|nr:tRNA (guanosine(37)-N1)-methyltransferase TrmD [Mycoplasma miroungirhinis]QJR44042.1 tRNA (guanosine(37)-N1)-methyltransferase TrmD [Mycoplasma miroungirhinis]
MKFNILTLFPEYFENFKTLSIMKKAIELGHISINVINWREFSTEKHKKVDDKVYGGGQGMLLQVEPIELALQTVGGKKILLSPQGKTFTQKMAREFAKLDEITLIAGHYEGFDERILNFVDEEISVGDYVLTGGEIPAMLITDAIARLTPGVIRENSHLEESFEGDGLLDFPQYTRPSEYKGFKVPEVLLNGNHAKIKEWRDKAKYQKTLKNRPDLIERIKNEK